MVSAKGHIMPKLTYHSTTIMLIFSSMLFSLFQILGWKPIISKQVPLLLVQVLTLTHYFPYRTSSELVPLDSPVRGTQKRVPYWGSSSYRFGVMAVQNVSPDSRETRALPPTCPQYTDDIYIQMPSQTLGSSVRSRQLVLCFVLVLGPSFDSVALVLL